MKVTCIANQGKDLSENTILKAHNIEAQFPLTIGQSHVVYGICIWRDVIHYLIVPFEDYYPIWFPADLFKVTNNNMLPSNWYFNNHENIGITAILGYKELALDESHYLGLIECEKKDIDVFNQRKKEIDDCC